MTSRHHVTTALLWLQVQDLAEAPAAAAAQGVDDICVPMVQVSDDFDLLPA